MKKIIYIILVIIVTAIGVTILLVNNKKEELSDENKELSYWEVLDNLKKAEYIDICRNMYPVDKNYNSCENSANEKLITINKSDEYFNDFLDIAIDRSYGTVSSGSGDDFSGYYYKMLLFDKDNSLIGGTEVGCTNPVYMEADKKYHNIVGNKECEEKQKELYDYLIKSDSKYEEMINTLKEMNK